LAINFLSALALGKVSAGSAGLTIMVWYWLVDLREPEQDARNTNKNKQPAMVSQAEGKQERDRYGNN